MTGKIHDRRTYDGSPTTQEDFSPRAKKRECDK